LPIRIRSTSARCGDLQSRWLEQVDGKRHENRLTGFGVYWMDVDGQRELLVSRRGWPAAARYRCARRARPPARPSLVDYARPTGTFYVQDVYEGPAMEGVARGTVKTLRVIGLDYRAAGIGRVTATADGGGALISTRPLWATAPGTPRS
jgi:hypothetical protein